MRRLGGLLALTVFAVLLAASPGVAATSQWWTAATTVSPVDDYAQDSQQVAGDSRGDAIVAWAGSGSIGYARRSSGGAFTAAHVLQGTGDSVRTAMNSSGDAVVVWRDGRVGVKGAIVPASGDPIPFAVQSGTKSCTSESVAAGIDDAGNVTVFWDDCNQIWRATRPAGGSFGSPLSIATPDQSENVTEMRAKVAGNGSTAIVWNDYDGVYAAYAAPGSPFTVTVLGSNKDTSALDYDTQIGTPGGATVDLNARGDAAVAWVQCRSGCVEYDVMATNRAAGGSFQRPQTIQSVDPQGGGPAVGIDSQGDASVAWVGFNYATRESGVWTASSSGGTYQTPALISSRSACAVALARDPQGGVYVVWNEYDPGGCQDGDGYELAAQAPAGSTTFSDPAVVGSGDPAEFPPSVVSQGSGAALAAWPQGDLGPDYQLRMKVAQIPGGSPPGPNAPAASTGTASAIAQGQATLSGSVNPHGVATHYSFEWGPTKSYGNITSPVDAGAGQSDTPITTTVGAFSPATTYHFRVVATSDAGTTYGADQTLTTLSTSAPSVVVMPASGGQTYATLTADVNPDGQATTYHFEWGSSTSYGHSVPIPDTAVGSDAGDHWVTQTISGLTAGAEYHYRVVATNSAGTAYSPDRAFNTWPAAPPTADTQAATDVGQTAATLNGTVNAQGAATTYHFEWGPDTTYGHQAPATDAAVGEDQADHSVTQSLSGLAPSTTYHFRIVATNSAGTSYGADEQFTTGAAAQPPAPTASTSAASTVTASAATLNGSANPHGSATSYHFEWGASSAYGNRIPETDTPVGSDSSVHAVSQTLSGLAPSTTYHYRIVATSAAGTTYGTDHTFTTEAQPEAPIGGATETPPPIAAPPLPALPQAPAAQNTATQLTTALAAPTEISLKQVLRHGVRPTISCSTTCTITASLSAYAVKHTSKASARIHLKPGQTAHLRLALSQRATRALKAARRPRLVLRVAVTSGTISRKLSRVIAITKAHAATGAR